MAQEEEPLLGSEQEVDEKLRLEDDIERYR
jgi:hypothetical protein